MLAIDLPITLEKQFWHVIQDSYQGDVQTALTAFLWLHEKYGTKEQFLRDIEAVRGEVKKRGGIKQKQITEAIQKHRQMIASGAALV